MRPFLSSIAFLCLFALPLAAQDEALVGTWEESIVAPLLGEVTLRVTFEANGDCQMIVFFPDDFFEIPPELSDSMPPIQGLAAHVNGPYRADGDSVWFEGAEVLLFVGDQPAEPAVYFWTELGRGLARVIAAVSGVPEEEYPAFEEVYVPRFVGGFLENQLAPYQIFVGYEIEGDTLFMPTGEVSTARYRLRRIDAATAVAPTTWGRLKAAWRP